MFLEIGIKQLFLILELCYLLRLPVLLIWSIIYDILSIQQTFQQRKIIWSDLVTNLQLSWSSLQQIEDIEILPSKAEKEIGDAGVHNSRWGWLTQDNRTDSLIRPPANYLLFHYSFFLPDKRILRHSDESPWLRPSMAAAGSQFHLRISKSIVERNSQNVMTNGAGDWQPHYTPHPSTFVINIYQLDKEKAMCVKENGILARIPNKYK